MVFMHRLTFHACTKPGLPGAFSLACVLALALGACGGGGEDSASSTDGGSSGGATGGSSGATEPTGGSTGGVPAGCDAYVVPGADDVIALQGALIEAADGSTVCLGEGVFMLNQEILISANHLTLKGVARDKSILDFSTQDLGGNGIKVSGDGVTMTAFTVRETPGDGIRGDDVAGITFDDVSVEWSAKASMDNGAYGFYPVGSTDVVIRNSRVIGARDAGIYVGQSKNILVEDCEAYDNVAGIEIENSIGATVRRNHAYNNTGGILIFNLPGLLLQGGKQTLAYENVVEDNNAENFGIPGTAVSAVPPGVGFMILSSDANEIRNNQIRNNNSTGVVIVSYNDMLGLEPADDPNFDAFPEGNWVHDNVFENNGSMPAPLLTVATGLMDVADILFDGCESPDNMMMDPARMNCVSGNGAADFMDFDLCNNFMNRSTDIMAATCMHTPLPDLPAG